MPLSEHEQRLLEQLEKQLHSEDPKFANSLGAEPRRALSARRLTLGVLVVVVGLLFIVFAVSLSMKSLPLGIGLGVVGFIAMLAGVTWALSGPKAGPAPQARSGQAQTPRRPQGGGDFMSKLEERWDRRRDDNR